MAWLIGFASYALLLIAVIVIASGRRRGDDRHSEAIHDLAALDSFGAVRVEPKRARVRVRPAGATATTGLSRRIS